MGDTEPKVVFYSFVNQLAEELDIEKKTNPDNIDKWLDKDKFWTKIIKESFGELGKNGKFKVYSNLHESEYLLDLVWEARDTKSGGLILGLESEWNNKGDEIEDDFYKLMYTKCKLKVFVYSSSSIENADKLICQFKEYLSWFDGHIPGEKYLFIDVTEYKDHNKIIGREFTISSSRILDRDTIEFQKIGEFDWDEINKNYRL